MPKIVDTITYGIMALYKFLLNYYFIIVIINTSIEDYLSDIFETIEFLADANVRRQQVKLS